LGCAGSRRRSRCCGAGYRGVRPVTATRGPAQRYWPVLVAVSMARPDSAFLPVTRVRM
jgi:hypothetical protein